MFKRCFFYVIGVLILGLGIILNTKTGLGVAAINSVPYGLSQMTSLSLGTWTTIMYVVFIILQLCIYKKLDIKVILQIPFSYLMGLLLDFYDSLMNFTINSIYVSFFLLIIAILLTALGAYLVVSMDFVPNPADGIVNALRFSLHKEFGQVKWMFDCAMICVTTVITLLFSGHVIGIGIGTICSALFIGRIIQVYTRLFGDYLNALVETKKQLEF